MAYLAIWDDSWMLKRLPGVFLNRRVRNRERRVIFELLVRNGNGEPADIVIIDYCPRRDGKITFISGVSNHDGIRGVELEHRSICHHEVNPSNLNVCCAAKIAGNLDIFGRRQRVVGIRLVAPWLPIFCTDYFQVAACRKHRGKMMTSKTGSCTSGTEKDIGVCFTFKHTAIDHPHMRSMWECDCLAIYLSFYPSSEQLLVKSWLQRSGIPGEGQPPSARYRGWPVLKCENSHATLCKIVACFMDGIDVILR